MLTTFKSKSVSDSKALSLAEILETWPSTAVPPRFLGKPKKDPPIDVWLAGVVEACKAQKVPKALWHEVARHFMSKDARKRLQDVEIVMKHVCGQRWAWKWSTFSVALKNMGWNVDPRKTESVKVQRKASGIWWIIGRGGEQGTKVKTKEPIPEPSFLARAARCVNVRTPTPSHTLKKASTCDSKTLKGSTQGTGSTSVLSRTLVALHLATPPPPPPATITAQVPLWLVAAAEAIYAFSNERSSAMSVLAAVLITVGSIPAMPAVSAGTTAHALGSIAVGLGTLLRERALAEAGK